MDVLILEPLEAEVLQWLESRFSVQYAPELAEDAAALRDALPKARALIVPHALLIDARTLRLAPRLRAVGRVSLGADNIDADACARYGVELVRSATASALAEAEFMVTAVLNLLRRVPVVTSDGLRVGRELGGATVGLVGLTAAARSTVQILGGFGSRVVGYDPALHANDGIWTRWRVEPMPLRMLIEECDAVCVQLPYFARFSGLFGERVLPMCKPSQVIVSISPSALFDERVLADLLNRGRMAAAWFDWADPGLLEPGRPLAEAPNLQITPRVAGTTRESRSRSAWAVAQRIDELLREQPVSKDAEGAVYPAGPIISAPPSAGLEDDELRSSRG